MKHLASYKEWIVLACMVVLGAVLTDGVFLDLGNLTDLVRANAPVAMMAMAMTLVILTGGIDLSVGSVLALSSVCTAMMLTQWDSDLPAAVQIVSALSLGALVGGLAGFVQGALIASLRMQPFIVTLAGMIGFRGLAKLLSQNNRIGLGVDRDSVAWQFGEQFSSKLGMIGFLLASIAICHVLLRYTVFGRYVRAIGDNPTAAHYVGLPIRRVQIAVYSLSGLMAGLAGVLMCARTRTGDANIGIAYELDAIAMVVIGGTSLAGGKGAVSGTVLGALILGTVINVLGLRNVDPNLQYILKALIIILAVAMQMRRPNK